MNTLKGYRVFFALLCLILMLAPAVGTADAGPMRQGETDFVAIDTYITEQMKALGIPGMALGTIEDGRIAHLQGFGAADSSGRAVTPQTPFYIGSVTKSFTALAVMQLVEAGKIDLDAAVQTYLPWFELADKEASAKITVRNLLNQTTGISEKDGNRFWASRQGSEEYVRSLRTIQLTRPVGSAFQYCNINFIIAGLIVEKVSGQSYADYVTRHILEPLDMRHSYASRAPALANGMAEGYHFVFGRAIKASRPMPPASLSAGALIASAEDLLHYAMAQLHEGRYGDTSILSPQGIAELHAPAVPTNQGSNHYAMGWFAGSVDGMPVIFHPGDTGHFRSTVLLIPGRDSGFVLLADATGYEQMSQAEGVVAGVFNLLNGKPAGPMPSLSFGPRFFYWAIPLIPLLQITGILLAWRQRRSIKGWSVLLTVILNLAAILLMFGLSQLVPFPLPSMLVYFPEVGYGLILIAALGIGWSVIYTAMYLRARR